MRAGVARFRARSKRHLATTALRFAPVIGCPGIVIGCSGTVFGSSGTSDRVLRNAVRVPPESVFRSRRNQCSGASGKRIQIVEEDLVVVLEGR